MPKDADFVQRVEQLGPPPQVIWVTLSNTSNAHMRTVLRQTFARALERLASGEPLVEISQPR